MTNDIKKMFEKEGFIYHPIAGGAEVKEWMKALPEELQSDASLAVFEDLPALAKGFVETKKAMGRYAGSVIIPAEGTKDDAPEMVEFLTKLGRPKEAKEYEAVIPNGVKLDPAMIEEFKALSYQLGMTKTQFKKAFGAQIAKIQRDDEAKKIASTEARNAQETSLRQTFGSKYPTVVAGIQKLINGLGEGATQDDIDEVLKRPGLVKMLSGVLDGLSEATLEKLGHSRGAELTPDEAKDEINAIRTSKEHPLNAAFNNPQAGEAYKRARARVDELYVMANPGKKKI